MDWGLAKVLASQDAEGPAEEGGLAGTHAPRMGTEDVAETRSGAVFGTLAYMPPEQARGEVDRIDRRADVFGLGAILCEILTGYPPFTGSSREILKQSANGDLEEAFARLDGCGADRELATLARACLAAEPESRLRDGA